MNSLPTLTNVTIRGRGRLATRRVISALIVASRLLTPVAMSSAAPAGYAWTLPNHFYLPSVVFSPDGRYLALAGSVGPAYDFCIQPMCEGRLHIWDLRSGHRTFANEAKFARVFSVVFSHDSQRLITGHSDGSVRVWSTNPIKVIQEYQCCGGRWIRALAISPDGKTLAIGAQSGQLVLWNFAGGQARNLPGHLYGVSSLAFDASGEYLLSAADDQHVRRWNVRTGATYEFSRSPDRQKAHRGMVKSVALLNHDRWAVTGAYWEGGTTKDYAGVAPPDPVLRLWDVDKGRPIRGYPLTWGIRGPIRILNDGHRVVFLKAAGWDEGPVLQVFNLDTGDVEREVGPTMGESFHAMGVHPDGQQVLINIGDGQYLLWNRASATVVAQLVSVDQGWAVLTPDGRIDFSDGFKSWPCQNNIRQACAGGTTASPVSGLLARVMGRAQ